MDQNIRSYAAKQGVITAACTVVICAIMFIFMIKTDMELSAIYLDLGLTVGCTGFICGLLQVFMTKGPVKKGVVPQAGSMDEQAAYLWVPKNAFAFLVIFTVFEVVMFALAPMGVISMCGGTMTRVSYIVLKSLMAGLAGGYATYHANVFVCALHQAKLTPAAK